MTIKAVATNIGDMNEAVGWWDFTYSPYSTPSTTSATETHKNFTAGRMAAAGVLTDHWCRYSAVSALLIVLCATGYVGSLRGSVALEQRQTEDKSLDESLEEPLAGYDAGRVLLDARLDVDDCSMRGRVQTP